MRRTPVMVAGVTAVLLGAGMLAATRAGAAETSPPAGPGFALSDLPGFSFFGHHAGSEVTGVDHVALDRPADPAAAAKNDNHDQSRTAGAAHAVPKQLKARQAPAADPQGALGDAALLAPAKAAVTASDLSKNPKARVQQQVLRLINENRRKHGCGRVTLDPRLIAAASSHAGDMARHHYFAHQSRNGEDPGDRVTQSGYQWRRYGENIAKGFGSPWGVVNGWMQSPGHRANILNCSLDQMGVGLAIAPDKHRTVYWVQDFGTPMR